MIVSASQKSKGFFHFTKNREQPILVIIGQVSIFADQMKKGTNRPLFLYPTQSLEAWIEVH